MKISRRVHEVDRIILLDKDAVFVLFSTGTSLDIRKASRAGTAIDILS